MIHAIVGCMWSGKTEELYRRLVRFVLAKNTVVVFEPKQNTRAVRALRAMENKSGIRMPGVRYVQSPRDILGKYKAVTARADVVAIDEAQFFHSEKDIAALLEVLNTLGAAKTIFVAGLDTDFLHRPFGAIPVVLAVADHVSKLAAVCTRCGGDATHTQRLVNGKPASRNSPLILIGDKSSYEPRCRRCFQIGIE